MPTIWDNFQHYLSQLLQPQYIPVCFHFSEYIHMEKQKVVIALRNKVAECKFPTKCGVSDHYLC